ncbi:hypothetical protein [Magnetospirillum sp. XM-1]|uniref:hypothetical protein n=1 Tax=Magnetospirillum sp. XM-1 TaxID=1663591 RepID=UPI0012E353AA
MVEVVTFVTCIPIFIGVSNRMDASKFDFCRPGAEYSRNQGVMANMESPKEHGNAVPGWTPELGIRLSEVYRLLGGMRAAGAICGSSDETLGKWRDGHARPSFLALAQLAVAAGVSLDWIAFGVEPQAQPAAAPDQAIAIDEELLEAAIVGVDEFIAERGLSIPSDRRAALVATIYALAVEDGAKDLAKKPSAIAKFIRLAAVG